MECLDEYLLEKVIACAVLGGVAEEEEENPRLTRPCWGVDTAKVAVRLSSVCTLWRCIVHEILKNSRNVAIRQAIRSAEELEATRFLFHHASTHVRDVDMSRSAFKYSRHFCDILYPHCKNLQTLDLSYGSMREHDLSRCLRLMAEAGLPKIRRLRTAHAPDTAGSGDWIKYTPHLEELDVSFCHRWNPLCRQQGDRALAWLQLGENLKRLSLTGCEQFELSVWWMYSPVKFYKLRVLNIAYVASVTDDNLMALINHCTPSLVQVSLTRNSFNNYNVGGYVSESAVIFLQSRNIKVSFVS
ncbi:hypothetical protein M9434_005407 [Picochlorum sp. BPE23]|nr:hypothetical protein M9434_005407 [Picochlorum sp. BPE23]